MKNKKKLIEELKIIEKLDYIHCAIQESMNKNDDMLFHALKCVEDIREKEFERL